MEPQEQHYNINKLNMLFAVASLILLACLGLMFKNDYDREWKGYQDKFHALEIEKTRVKYSLEEDRLQQQSDYQKLKDDLEKARKDYVVQCGGLTDVKKSLKSLETEDEIVSQQFRVTKAELDAAKFAYEEVLGKGKGDLEKAKARYDALGQKVDELNRRLEKNKTARAEKQAAIDQCGKGLTELERNERTVTAQLTVLERKLKKIDPAAMDMTNEIANLVRDLPVIDFANPKDKIEQIVLKDLTDDVNFMRVPKVDRCISCHMGIANPDYQDAPQPFRTHPHLELYLSKNSPHPMEDFGCTTCHGGRGRGTDFISTAHTPSSEKQQKEWEEKYHWKEIHHWETPMYSRQYVEAGCFQCHSGETVIKGAEQLNLGLNLIEKSGCYACHLIDKYKDWPKPGPDLTHIAAKTNANWAYHWIEDPTSFRHHTWMPSFFGQSNNSDKLSQRRTEQEIHAIVHYLFAHSTDFPLEEPPGWGDAKRGEEIVASVGCFACHVSEHQPTDAKRDRQRLLREQGPNLVGIGTKTTTKWIYQWLKDPNRYHPETKMPNLRLSDKEAADVAAFLTQDHVLGVENKPTPPVNAEVINEIAGDYLAKSMTREQAQGKLKGMPMDEKLDFAGQKLIAHYGCYSCHNISGFENFKPIGTELTEEGSKAAEKLDFGFINIEHNKQVWFVQKLKNPRIFDKDKIKAPDEKLRMPNFHFTDEEAEAITTAILGFTKDKPGSSKLPARTPRQAYVEEGQKIIREYNCQGCHIIEGDGGAIQPKVVEWLVKYDNRAENEAQAMVGSFSPPNLVGEGKKVYSEWLFNFIHQPIIIRPWLKTRMPTYHFDTAQLNTIVKYFNALDDAEFPFSGHGDMAVTPEEYQAGAKLFSNEYFACAQCHIVGDKMPAGSPDSWAPNFALAKSRLKPEWLDTWLKNPQDLLPGTKMPTFFDPNSFDASGPEDILGGDELRQIRALRNYVLSIADQPLSAQPEKPATEAQPQPDASSQ